MTAKADCSTQSEAGSEALARENAQLRAELTKARELLNGYEALIVSLRVSCRDLNAEVTALTGQLCAASYLAEAHGAARDVAEGRVNALIADRISYAPREEVPVTPPAWVDYSYPDGSISVVDVPPSRDPAAGGRSWLVTLTDPAPSEAAPGGAAPGGAAPSEAAPGGAAPGGAAPSGQSGASDGAKNGGA